MNILCTLHTHFFSRMFSYMTRSEARTSNPIWLFFVFSFSRYVWFACNFLFILFLFSCVASFLIFSRMDLYFQHVFCGHRCVCVCVYIWKSSIGRHYMYFFPYYIVALFNLCRLWVFHFQVENVKTACIRIEKIHRENSTKTTTQRHAFMLFWSRIACIFICTEKERNNNGKNEKKNIYIHWLPRDSF